MCRKRGKVREGGTSTETEAEWKGSLALAEVGTAQMLGLGDVKA